MPIDCKSGCIFSYSPHLKKLMFSSISSSVVFPFSKTLIFVSISLASESFRISSTISMMSFCTSLDFRLKKRSQLLPPGTPKKVATEPTSCPPLPIKNEDSNARVFSSVQDPSLFDLGTVSWDPRWCSSLASVLFFE